MIIFYARVSSKDQNLERQLELAKTIGAEKVYQEKESGIKYDRPELQKMLSFAREGDIIHVESISRLSRSIRDLLKIVDTFEKNGIKFVSHKENIDTSTPQGRFILSIFAALAELEREQTKQRQAEGIAIAKKEGKYKGRKPIAIDNKKFESMFDYWKAGKISSSDFMNEFGLKPNTFYRRIREIEERRSVDE